MSNIERIRILSLLVKKELTVSEIADYLEISIKRASYHLLRLENVGLAKRRYRWRWVYYLINSKAKNRYLKAIVDIFKKSFHHS